MLNIRTLLFIILITFLQFGFSQSSPVLWTFSYEDKGNKVLVTATAKIAKNWAIYSQFTNDEGPIPTAFYVGEERLDWKEVTKPIKQMDPLFEIEVIKFKNQAIFTLEMEKSRIHSKDGKVIFMCCDDEKCLPPAEVAFKISW